MYLAGMELMLQTRLAQTQRSVSVVQLLGLKARATMPSGNNCILFLCVSILPACIYTTCMPGALGGQRRALDPLELELQIDVSYI